MLVPMMVHLSVHGQELLEAALARGVGRSPEEVVERALEAAHGTVTTLPNEELERRRQAVAGMMAFREEYHLTLGPGERIPDLIHEGHNRDTGGPARTRTADLLRVKYYVTLLYIDGTATYKHIFDVIIV